MAHPALRILQVNTHDLSGGAEKISWELFQEYRRRGLASWLTVGRKRGNDPDVFRMPHHLGATNPWSRAWWQAHRCLQPLYQHVPGARFLCRATHALAAPRGVTDYWFGYEDFNYPGAMRVLDTFQQQPTILHCHNLHGKYFDLRALVTLSRRIPVFVTLHDAWMFTGHCAHFFECRRWTTGCGNCPTLDTYPAIRRDASNFNWRRKREIYNQCRLYVAAPSRWLLDLAKRSILAPALAEARVIPNGIDLSVFRPADKYAARAEIGVPPDARLLLFVANGVRRNPFKDYVTLRAAIEQIVRRDNNPATIFLALGDQAASERLGSATIRFVPFQKCPMDVARYYQAADVYIHAARADTFPNTVLEALACGTPVVTTAVGGIAEQVTAVTHGSDRLANVTYAQSVEQATGILVPPHDADSLASGIMRLLDDDTLRQRLGENAARDASRRFDLRRQADEYLAWYAAVTEKNQSHAGRIIVKLPQKQPINAV